MKIFGLLILLFIGFTGFTQQKQSPDFYLNSEKIDHNKVFLNKTNIDSVHVKKDTPNGAVYILTKDRKFNFVTLLEIVRKHTDIKEIDNSLLFKIDGKIIEDPTEIRIDASYFVYVNVKNLAGVKYLKDCFQEMKIVNIELATTERKQPIMIRGNEFGFLKEHVH